MKSLNDSNMTVDEALKYLREFAEDTRGYGGDWAVVVDNDPLHFRVSVDARYHLVIVHGGSMPFYDKAADKAGGMFISVAPYLTLADRIKGSRAAFPKLDEETLGTTDEVHALTQQFIAQLEAMKAAQAPAPKTSRKKIMIALTVGIAVTATITGGVIWARRHYPHS